MASSMTVKQLATGYFLCQAIGVILWWVILLKMDSSMQSTFFSEGVEPAALKKFIVPDLLVMGGLSAIAGCLGLLRHRATSVAGWMACGATAYALAGAIAVNWPLGTRPAADILMIVAMVGTAWAARGLAKP